LLRHGVRRNLAGYSFFLERREAGAPRLGILVSKKHAARAVQRNRIKRCVREAFRLEQEGLGAVDLLVRPPYGIGPSPQMISRLRELLRQLRQA
jgi:ribonuclease P protein component